MRLCGLDGLGEADLRIFASDINQNSEFEIRELPVEVSFLTKKNPHFLPELVAEKDYWRIGHGLLVKDIQKSNQSIYSN